VLDKEPISTLRADPRQNFALLSSVERYLHLVAGDWLVRMIWFERFQNPNPFLRNTRYSHGVEAATSASSQSTEFRCRVFTDAAWINGVSVPYFFTSGLGEEPGFRQK
jgi:hypothetical protein